VDRREFLELVAGLSALVPGLVGAPAWAEAQERAQATTRLRTLDPLQDATVTRVADILVPQTDTVGATAVGVTAFIDLLLTESMLPAQRERFLEGLAVINARCRERYAAPLPAAKPAEQQALLRTLDELVAALAQRIPEEDRTLSSVGRVVIPLLPHVVGRERTHVGRGVAVREVRLVRLLQPRLEALPREGRALAKDHGDLGRDFLASSHLFGGIHENSDS